MVLLASASKPFEINMKGKPSRVKVLTSYDTEINQAYIDFGGASSLQGDLKKWIVPTPWTTDYLTEFVMGVIEDGIERKVGLDDDIFALGCDRYVCFDFVRFSLLTLEMMQFTIAEDRKRDSGVYE